MNSSGGPTRVKDIKRYWHLVDMGGQILGRTATRIATLLTGKTKPYFVRHLDCGDYVVVVNGREVKVTGNKLTQKIYTTYSGFPGGLRKESLRELRARKPEEIIRHAVYGMLPKNKLREQMIKRLYIYPEATHPYANKFELKK